MQWNIRRRKTRSERLRETSCCDEWRYGDVVIADLAIVFSETSGILISHFYERVFALPSHFMRESRPSMATCAPYAPLKKRRHSAMKSPPSSEHGLAHPVKTWPSSLVSRFPHFLKTRFTRFPHFSGYRAALFRPRDCIKRRFRRFYRLTVKRRAATRPACGMEVRLVPRHPCRRAGP